MGTAVGASDGDKLGIPEGKRLGEMVGTIVGT